MINFIVILKIRERENTKCLKNSNPRKQKDCMLPAALQLQFLVYLSSLCFIKVRN